MNVVVLRSSFLVILLFYSVVPQTTVILNNDRQNAIVAKMEDPLSGRAPDSLENIISKSVATHHPTFPCHGDENKSHPESGTARARGPSLWWQAQPGLCEVGEGTALRGWGTVRCES